MSYWMEHDGSCSPLVTFIVCLNVGVSIDNQWLADALFLSAPITTAAGCRLILSVREAASHYHHLPSASNPVSISIFAVQDGPLEEDMSSFNSDIEL